MGGLGGGWCELPDIELVGMGVEMRIERPANKLEWNPF